MARAAMFAAVCVGVSAAGHVWMSGPSIPVWALCMAVLGAGHAGYALAGRQRTFASIAPLMLAGELGLHLLFAAAQRTGDTAAAASSMPWMPDMSRIKTAHPLPASAWLCGPMSGAGTSPGHGAMASMTWLSAHHSAGMVAVHVAAGLLCSWWLACGEAATFRLLRTIARYAPPQLFAFVRLVASSVPDLTTRIVLDTDEPTSAGRVLLVHAVIRRGPPAAVFSM